MNNHRFFRDPQPVDIKLPFPSRFIKRAATGSLFLCLLAFALSGKWMFVPLAGEAQLDTKYLEA